MINTQNIKKQIKKLELKQEYIAYEMGISQSSLSQKINNVRKIEIEEMFLLASILEIEDENLRKYFLKGENNE